MRKRALLYQPRVDFVSMDINVDAITSPSSFPVSGPHLQALRACSILDHNSAVRSQWQMRGRVQKYKLEKCETGQKYKIQSAG